MTDRRKKPVSPEDTEAMDQAADKINAEHENALFALLRAKKAEIREEITEEAKEEFKEEFEDLQKFLSEASSPECPNSGALKEMMDAREDRAIRMISLRHATEVHQINHSSIDNEKTKASKFWLLVTQMEDYIKDGNIPSESLNPK